jgi:predicted transcriptional regulator
MARRAAYDELLMVKLPPTLKSRLKRAAAASRTDMSKLTREAIEEHLERLERGERVHRMIENARGSADAGLSTDEIMALTRGE